MIRVTCAIISFNGKILVVQRSEKMSLPLKWEFPGGKIEQGESEADCIKREIKEELGIDIQLDRQLSPSIFNYPTIDICLIPFLANYVAGELKLTEHSQFKLLEKAQLRDLDWAEADLPILNEYLAL